MDDLERRLQAMSAVLDELSSSSRVDDDGAAADEDLGDEWELAEESPDRHARTRRWLMVAAALVLVGSAGYAIGRQREAPSTAVSAPADVEDFGVEECLTELRIPEDGSYDVVAFPTDDAGRTFVLAAGPDEVRLCRRLRGASSTTYEIPLSDEEISPTGMSRSDLASVGWRWSASSDRGDYVFFGRTGAVVAGVDAVFPDGTRIPGAVVDGWYMVDGEGPPDAGFEVRFEWTLRSGTGRSAELDSVDARATPAERCAVVEGCVDVQLERLRRQAGGTPQEGELDDGEVSASELTAAVDRTIECLAEHGVEGAWDGRDLVAHVGGTRTDDEATVTRCTSEHLDLVQAATELVDARRRLETDGPALGTIGGLLVDGNARIDTCTGTEAPHPTLRALADEHLAALCAQMLYDVAGPLDLGDPVEWCTTGLAPEVRPFDQEQLDALCAHLQSLDH